MKSGFSISTKANLGSIYSAFLGLYHQLIRSDFAQKVAETFATRVLLIGVGLVTSVIVARILGPEGRGLYAVATAVGAIGVQFGNLGLHASNTYYVAKDRSLLPTLLGNTLLVSFGLGSFGAFAAGLIFYLWSGLAPVHGLLLTLALLWVPFGLAYMLLQNLLLGIQEVRAYNAIELTTKIIAVALVGAIIIFQIVAVETVFFATLAALIISFIWALWRLYPHLNHFPQASFSLFKENIGYGFKAYLAAFFSFLVLRADLLIVKYLLGAEQTGYYSIAVRMADMVYMLPVVIGAILFPTLSALPNNREKWEFTQKVVFWVGVAMVILGGFAVLLAKPAVWLLYGEAFLPSVPAFSWLTLGIVLLSINAVFMNYFASTGMPLVTVYSPAIAIVFNVVLNFRLVPWLGIVGASFASIVSYGLMLIISIVYISAKKDERLPT